MPSSSACSVNTWPARWLRGALEQRLVHVVGADAVDADQLIERRQRGRQLRAARCALPADSSGTNGDCTARVRGVAKAQLLLEPSAASFICQPAAPCTCGSIAEDLSKPLAPHAASARASRPRRAALTKSCQVV